jgi:hypothetical protein
MFMKIRSLSPWYCHTWSCVTKSVVYSLAGVVSKPFLNKPKLMLVYSTAAFWRLVSYVVGRHDLCAVVRICINE